MPSSNRCKCYTLVNSSKNKQTRCKNTKYKLNFCYKHYIDYATKYAIIIQRIYIGHLTRKRIQRFKLLPREIQKKIIYYMNEQIYLKRLNDSIYYVIYNRLENFYRNNRKTMINFLNLDHIPDLSPYTTIAKELNNIISLHKKYCLILYNTALFPTIYILKLYAIKFNSYSNHLNKNFDNSNKEFVIDNLNWFINYNDSFYWKYHIQFRDKTFDKTDYETDMINRETLSQTYNDIWENVQDKFITYDQRIIFTPNLQDN